MYRVLKLLHQRWIFHRLSAVRQLLIHRTIELRRCNIVRNSWVQRRKLVSPEQSHLFGDLRAEFLLLNFESTVLANLAPAVFTYSFDALVKILDCHLEQLSFERFALHSLRMERVVESVFLPHYLALAYYRTLKIEFLSVALEGLVLQSLHILMFFFQGSFEE